MGDSSEFDREEKVTKVLTCSSKVPSSPITVMRSFAIFVDGVILQFFPSDERKGPERIQKCKFTWEDDLTCLQASKSKP